MGCGGLFTDTYQQLIFHAPPWFCLRCLGTDGTECGSRMEEHLTLENRASVSLVCKRAAGKLQPDRRTWNTSGDCHLCHREKKRLPVFQSSISRVYLLLTLFIILFSCVFSVLCKSSPANTMSPRWRRGSHLVLHYKMLQPRTLGHGG